MPRPRHWVSRWHAVNGHAKIARRFDVQFVCIAGASAGPPARTPWLAKIQESLCQSTVIDKQHKQPAPSAVAAVSDTQAKFRKRRIQNRSLQLLAGAAGRRALCHKDSHRATASSPWGMACHQKGRVRELARASTLFQLSHRISGRFGPQRIYLRSGFRLRAVDQAPLRRISALSGQKALAPGAAAVSCLSHLKLA